MKFDELLAQYQSAIPTPEGCNNQGIDGIDMNLDINRLKNGDTMELSKMSLTELRRLQAKVETEIRRRSDTARRDLLKKMQKMAAEEGLTLDDLLPAAAEEKPAKKRGKAKAAGKKSAPVPVKYRNPENPDIGWSGRGRKPQWVVSWLAQNKPLSELEVKAA